MTDMASALAAKPLAPYKGRDVLRTALAIRNAGDGLSAAMKVDPIELDLGARVYVVLECDVAQHDYMEIPDTSALELKQVLKAGAAVIVDADLVREHLDRQAERIKAAQDAAKGVVNLEGEPGWLTDSNGKKGGPVDEGSGDEADENAVLRRNHMAGNHNETGMPGCPMCSDVADAKDARTVEELRSACKEAGIAYTGADRKADLIAKLTAS